MYNNYVDGLSFYIRRGEGVGGQGIEANHINNTCTGLFPCVPISQLCYEGRLNSLSPYLYSGPGPPWTISFT